MRNTLTVKERLELGQLLDELHLAARDTEIQLVAQSDATVGILGCIKVFGLTEKFKARCIELNLLAVNPDYGKTK